MKHLLYFILLSSSMAVNAQYRMEYLNRGVYAVNSGNGKVFVSWRLLRTEDNILAFNVYITTDGKTVKLNTQPIGSATGLTDANADVTKDNTYTVRAIIKNKEEKSGETFKLVAN